HLPRHDVRVMFHLGDEDLVAWADARAAERGRNEVDGFRRAADEYDFARVGGVEEPPYAFARRIVGLGGFDAERVDAAMDVRVFLGVVPHQTIDDRLRLLRGRGVVEIDERFT